MLNKTTALLSALLISSVAHGGEIYKWKDKDGQVHFGDSSTQAKMQNSEKVQLNGTTVTATQHKEAEEIATRNKLQAADKQNTTPATSPPVGSTQTSQNISPSKRKEKECRKEWRRYKESQDCFAPYAINGGGVRGDAYEHCADVRQPTQYCD